MKKLFLLLLVITSFSNVSNAQDTITSERSGTTNDEDALKAANSILTTPYFADSPKRKEAMQLLIKWMTDTPDFSFTVEPAVMKKIVGEDQGLLSLYMASMAKYALENREKAKDPKQVELNAVKMMIAYAEKSENGLKMSEAFRKVAEANKKGELEKELNK